VQQPMNKNVYVEYNMPRKPRAPRARAVPRKPKMGGLKKVIKAIAKDEALATQETKYQTYYSPEVGGTLNVFNQLISKLTPNVMSGLQTAIPAMGAQGTTSSNIVGNKIRLINGYTKFQFHFDTGAYAYNQDIVLKLFLLKSRKVKDYNAGLVGLPGSDLLRFNGDGFTDFDPYTTTSLVNNPIQFNQMSLNNLAWTGKVVTIRLCKNTGSPNFNATIPAVPGDVPNLSSKLNYYEHVWNWTDDKKDKILSYDTAILAGGHPTNYLPLWGVVAYYPDGNPVSPTTPVQLPVRIVYSNHMWFKDA